MKTNLQALSVQAFFVLAVVMLVNPIPMTAQVQLPGAIEGKVVDASNGEALPGANVQILGSLLGSSTNAEGQFRIAKLEPGAYSLRASFIGYEVSRITVKVAPDSLTTVRFALKPSPIEMAQVVVTASREVERIQSTVVSVSALTPQAVLRRNSLRLDAALESVPGVSLVGENVNVRNSSGYTRGISNRVLILMDYVPVLTSDFGNMYWDILPVMDFERVEVIKGPYSALYGSYALGGVINIITKSPQPQGRFSIRTSAGVYDDPYEPEWKWTDRQLSFNRIDLSYSKRIGKLGFRFSFGRHESTGDRQNRHFQRWNGTGKLIWSFSEASELILFGAYARDRRGEFVLSRGENPYLVPTEFLPYRISIDAYTFYAQYRLRANDWLEFNWRAALVRQVTGNQFKVEGDFQPAQGPSADWHIHARLDSSMSFKLGLEYRYDFAEQRDIGRHFAYTISPYIHQVWTPTARLRFSAGLRYDHYYLLPGPDFQTQFVKRPPVRNPLPDGIERQHLSPQLGLSYEITASTSVRTAAGWGIRIPALGERFLQFEQPFRFVLNANVEIERSFSYEIGLRQRLGQHVFLEATGFHTVYLDLIEPLIREDASLELINIPEARIPGVEVSGRFSFWRNRLGLEASATWTEPEITDVGEGGQVPVHFHEGDLLSYRPRLIAYISPSVRLGPFAIEADYGYASKLEREQLQIYRDDQRVPKKQLDGRLLCYVSKLTLQLSARNVLHYNYYQVERNINEVRSYAAGLQWEY